MRVADIFGSLKHPWALITETQQTSNGYALCKTVLAAFCFLTRESEEIQTFFLNNVHLPPTSLLVGRSMFTWFFFLIAWRNPKTKMFTKTICDKIQWSSTVWSLGLFTWTQPIYTHRWRPTFWHVWISQGMNWCLYAAVVISRLWWVLVSCVNQGVHLILY